MGDCLPVFGVGFKIIEHGLPALLLHFYGIGFFGFKSFGDGGEAIMLLEKHFHHPAIIEYGA